MLQMFARHQSTRPTPGRSGVAANLAVTAKPRRAGWLRRVLATLFITVAALMTVAGPAHADATRDALYGMGATVGGSTSPAYYSPAQFYPQTSCTGNTNRVSTVILASPRNGSGGQWFSTRVWARDITGAYGAWKDYGAAQSFIPEYNSMSYSMADYRELATQTFVGYDGHHYQVYVQAWVANSNNQWESIGSKFSNHYSSLGASEPNIYGQTLQRIPGAASDYCTVY